MGNYSFRLADLVFFRVCKLNLFSALSIIPTMLIMHSCITDTVQSQKFTASVNNMLKKINS